ncbi:hypothetical protein E6C72_27955 [Azospirillum sp. TSH100]|nr:hypothetical protein E6C72_27955 [Azospirillum sp. TSH100]
MRWPKLALSPPGRGLGEGEARQGFHKDPATHPPHPDPLPAIGGPMVRLSRQRKRSLRVSGGRGDQSRQ